ncbi:GNAT family N-acetyltransferase [Polymorphospora lycopeni]|uniref:GNAT family N-acetyltransferase n=1 Tax=Polymorphospora lycopeni TaxID=3140240 RepID=A0ABV5CRC7_9ACTN
MTEAELPIQPATPDDWDEVGALMAASFHHALESDVHESERLVFEPDRSLVVRDEGRVVAHAAAFTRDLTVPGAVVPATHVTMVGVAPTHRRRRLLTRLMERQLGEARDAGREPVAVLWASEGRIYPRFGYGLASQRLVLDVTALEAGLPEAAGGRLRTGPPDTFRTELADLYDRLLPDRPGWSSRPGRWWDHLLGDFPGQRDGATERRAVLYEGADGVEGYALWRTKGGWTPGGPTGEVRVQEVVAATPDAYRQLWRFLLSIDLTRTATYPFGSLDEPLQHLVAEPRQLVPRVADALWVRLLDVGAALAARRYRTPVDVVVDVTDPLLPDNTGRWRLTGDRTGAHCERTGGPADLTCDVRDLGAVYLGGPDLNALAAAGRVGELVPGAVARTAAAFGWDRAPASLEVF